MTNRADRCGLLVAFSMLLITPATSEAQQLPPVAQQMAKTYGLDSFRKIEAIRYTFTIEGAFLLERGNGTQKPIRSPTRERIRKASRSRLRMRRSEIGSQSDAVKNQIDPGFVNDQYWLLLPLHVAWDGASVTDEGMHETPLGKKSAERIVVKYASAGYSPGDTWELYVGADKRVEEMTYHRAVPVPGLPNVVNATWEGYQKAGPLLISTDHHGTGDGKPFQPYLLGCVG